jgi:hypothetical protein
MIEGETRAWSSMATLAPTLKRRHAARHDASASARTIETRAGQGRSRKGCQS